MDPNDDLGAALTGLMTSLGPSQQQFDPGNASPGLPQMGPQAGGGGLPPPILEKLFGNKTGIEGMGSIPVGPQTDVTVSGGFNRPTPEDRPDWSLKGGLREEVLMADIPVAPALTGDEEEPTNLKSIVSGAGGALNRAIFDDPASRSALLQIGLQLMQPVAMGQSAAGHFGQGVGAGGEAVGRIEEADQKERFGQGKLDAAEERNRIAQQRADTLQQRLESGESSGITATLQYQFQQNQRREAIAERQRREKEIKAEVERIATRAKAIGADSLYPDDEEIKQYRNMPRSAIEADVRRKDIEAYGPLPDLVQPELKPTIRQPKGAGVTRKKTTAASPDEENPDENDPDPNPKVVIQNGHRYVRQPDGSYK